MDLDEENEMEEGIELPELDKKQKRKIWDVVMLICLIIAMYLLISMSFRAGGIQACQNSGDELMIKPEFKCWSEEDEIKKNNLYADMWINHNASILGELEK